MLSNKPYLIRAFYEWIVDSRCTPLFVINAAFPRCSVPLEFVENNEIILNAAPEAIRDLKIGNDLLEFRASFSGVVHIISAPIKAILAVYAEENGQGMYFDYEDDDGQSDFTVPETANVAAVETQKIQKKASHLKLVE